METDSFFISYYVFIPSPKNFIHLQSKPFPLSNFLNTFKSKC